jgi:hypothetical protein
MFKFLKAARNLVNQGMSKEAIEQFARNEFGEINELFQKQIDNLFKQKQGIENIKIKDEVFDDTIVKLPIDDTGVPFNPKDPMKQYGKPKKTDNFNLSEDDPMGDLEKIIKGEGETGLPKKPKKPRDEKYTGGLVDVEPSLSDIGHGSDALMARTRLMSPGSQATTSTGLNYLLAEDNDNIRVPFSKGKGVDFLRRGFLKTMGAAGAGIAALKTGLLGLGGKQATKEVAKEIITTPAAAGKPAWFDALVTRVVNEGEDVTKKFATKDREIVHATKVDDDAMVTVYRDLDDGTVRVDIDDATTNVMGEQGDSVVSLEVKGGQLEEGVKGKTPVEFEAREADYRNYMDGPDDYTTETIDNVVGDTKDLTADLTKVKMYAKGQKKPTIKEMMIQRDRAKTLKQAEENPAEYAADRGPDIDTKDYDYASGGRAGYAVGNQVMPAVDARMNLDYNTLVNQNEAQRTTQAQNRNPVKQNFLDKMKRSFPVAETFMNVAAPAINLGRGILGLQDPIGTPSMGDRMRELEATKGPTGSIGYEDYGLPVATPGGRFTGGLPELALKNPVDFALAGSAGRYGFSPEGRTDLEYNFTPDQDTGSTGNAILDFVNEGGVKAKVSDLLTPTTTEAAETTPTPNASTDRPTMADVAGPSNLDNFRDALYAANQFDKETGDRLFGGQLERMQSEYLNSPNDYFFAGDDTQSMYDRFNKIYNPSQTLASGGIARMIGE